jgi:dynein heavy chain
VITDKVQ